MVTRLAKISLNRGRERERQAVTKDLTSSSKFSGSCVLTLQPLPENIHVTVELSVGEDFMRRRVHP